MRDDYTGRMEVELRAAPSIGRKIKSADLPLPYLTVFAPRYVRDIVRRVFVEREWNGSYASEEDGKFNARKEKEGREERDTRRAVRRKVKRVEDRGGRGKRERGVDSFLFRCGRRGDGGRGG